MSATLQQALAELRAELAERETRAQLRQASLDAARQLSVHAHQSAEEVRKVVTVLDAFLQAELTSL